MLEDDIPLNTPKGKVRPGVFQRPAGMVKAVKAVRGVGTVPVIEKVVDVYKRQCECRADEPECCRP